MGNKKHEPQEPKPINWRKLKKTLRAITAPGTARGGRNGSNRALHWVIHRQTNKAKWD